LVGQAQVGGHAGEVALAGGQAFERRPGAQPHAVAGDRVTGDGREHPTEVVRRDLARVAADLGLTDQSHLCRVLRSETGVVPSALRRLLT
jgi:AraC-like DNA-binding protein